MLATFFEWTVHPGREDEFISTWEEETKLLLKEGSLGSALFRGRHERFSALARWPDAVTRDTAFERLRDHKIFARMHECVVETHCRDDAEEISNMWRVA